MSKPGPGHVNCFTPTVSPAETRVTWSTSPCNQGEPGAKVRNPGELDAYPSLDCIQPNASGLDTLVRLDVEDTEGEGSLS